MAKIKAEAEAKIIMGEAQAKSDSLRIEADNEAEIIRANAST